MIQPALPKPPRLPLAFGTSGLRGLVTDITDFEAYVNTLGFLSYLSELGELRAGGSVALAGDLRPSTDSPERSILRAVARAVADSGHRVVHCGKIPTPALSSYAFAEASPSIMVTGSHIPFDRNGIKFNKRAGEVLKSDEAPILSAVERARRATTSPGTNGSLFDEEGMFRDAGANALTEVDLRARKEYARRYAAFFPERALAGQVVLVYEHSAVGRDILQEILRALGATVHALGRSETFVPIDTEALGARQLEELQALVDRARAEFGHIDAVVSTDGDSDRPLVLAVDGQGQAHFISGDVLGILVADYLQADSLVVPVTATDAIDLHFESRGTARVRTRVGSPWVIAAAASLSGQRQVGWEANGGFFTFTELTREGRKLAPLPTRDALLPILAVLHAASANKLGMAGLLRELPPRFTAAGLIDHVPVEQGRELLGRLGAGEDGVIDVRFSPQGVRLALARGSERVPSGELAARLNEVRTVLARHFDAANGFAAVSALNFLDGVRIYFQNGDIAHVRPSGNAPQLRIYSVAASEERARAIVSLALAEPVGILRSLLRAR